MFNVVRKEFQYGDNTVVLETGHIARQASGAVKITMGETTVLVTVVAKKEAQEGQSFFPLTVNYVEKFYAAGRIPGGFLKREGRPSDRETLTARLIDRPIRPLFPNGFLNEVQVVCTVISAEKGVEPDVIAMLGTSAALAISGVPFSGPIGAARVGYQDGMYILNPNHEALETSKLDLVVAGTDKAVLMVESEADELTEDQMLGGVLFGHMEMQKAITAIKEFAAEVGVEQWEWNPAEENAELKAAVATQSAEGIKAAYQIKEKMERYAKVGELRAAAVEALAKEDGPSAKEVEGTFAKLEKKVVRGSVLETKSRIDGRDLSTVRPIDVQVGALDRTHGSSVFTRGETQAIVVATLGSMGEGQLLDGIQGKKEDHFILHYNFPPYCVGETGFIGSPKRREIGHGNLARRGISAVLPHTDNFPYTIRVVSEITESNGSSSMASVCGSSLALMDAGVPLKAPVAGIAMGLVKEEGDFAVLSDILGDEDHLGDMDFKVAGTADGVTALQMDIKIEGITDEIMEIALTQAKEGRLHILGEMNKVLAASRENVASTAPAFIQTTVPKDKIRDIIGKGGATIRGLCDETGCQINIDDDGSVNIYGETREGAEAAKAKIDGLCEVPEVGAVYPAKVARIEAYGAFVTLPMGVDGLVHVSEIAHERVEKVEDYLQIGSEIQVKLLEIDNRGRLKLSIKATLDQAAPAAE